MNEQKAIESLQTTTRKHIVSAEEIAEAVEELKKAEERALKEAEPSYTGIAALVMSTFTTNSQAKRNSGITEEILKCAYANMGRYTPDEKAKIEDSGQPLVYMKLTSSRVKAAQSLIKDILLADDDIFTITEEEKAGLPTGIKQKIHDGIMELRDKQARGEEPPSNQPNVEGNKVTKAQATIIDELEEARNIESALYEELRKHAAHEIRKINRLVKLDLETGGWSDDLSEFIDDYCIFPTAFMRGCIMQRDQKLVWEKGVPVVKESTLFKNKRIHPLDIYPDPGSPDLAHGNIIEHARFTPEDLEVLIAAAPKSTFADRLREMLDRGPAGAPWFADQGVEADKAETEVRGSSLDSSTGIYHALIFSGRVPTKDIMEDGIIPRNPDAMSEEVRAIMVDGQLVSVKINNDPLKRRYYYHASYHNVPGSVWGVGLPTLMEDIQKMCNATARALAVNMAFSAGPQCVVQVERLVDSGDISEQHPLKIWQVEPPRAGNEGKVVDFFTVPSVANELVAVYDKYEARADDATGIPKYSYGGNTGGGGAGSTARGLGMLLESSSKTLKESIRHIDKGLITPRVEAQFFWTLRFHPEIGYTGGLNVIAHGSRVLAIKSALEEKRREFFQLTSNEFDFKTIKQTGRAAMLREIAKDCKFEEEVVPNALKLKFDIAKDAEMREREMRAQEQQARGNEKAVAAAKVQADASLQIANSNAKIKEEQINLDARKHQDKVAIEIEKIKTSRDNANTKAMADVEKSKTIADASKKNTQVKSAVDLTLKK